MRKKIFSEKRREEFEIVGEDIDDYHQDWLINGIKVTFFDNSSDAGIKDVFKEDKYETYGNIKISSVESIFKMKSLMFYSRSKVRDYFDLFVLYNSGLENCTPKDTMELIQKYELAYQGESGKEMFFHLLDTKIEGYNSQYDAPIYTLIDNAPSFEELADYIRRSLSDNLSSIEKLAVENNKRLNIKHKSISNFYKENTSQLILPRLLQTIEDYFSNHDIIVISDFWDKYDSIKDEISQEYETLELIKIDKLFDVLNQKLLSSDMDDSLTHNEFINIFNQAKLDYEAHTSNTTVLNSEENSNDKQEEIVKIKKDPSIGPSI